MPISPIASTLPRPSSANFSFIPDAVETQEVYSNQECSLQNRIKLAVDRWGYRIHLYFNPPPKLLPIELAEAQYEVDKRNFFCEKTTTL